MFWMQLLHHPMALIHLEVPIVGSSQIFFSVQVNMHRSSFQAGARWRSSTNDMIMLLVVCHSPLVWPKRKIAPIYFLSKHYANSQLPRGYLPRRAKAMPDVQELRYYHVAYHVGHGLTWYMHLPRRAWPDVVVYYKYTTSGMARRDRSKYNKPRRVMPEVVFTCTYHVGHGLTW